MPPNPHQFVKEKFKCSPLNNACNTSKMKLQSGTLLHDLPMLRHGQITRQSDLFSPLLRSLRSANLLLSPVKDPTKLLRSFTGCETAKTFSSNLFTVG